MAGYSGTPLSKKLGVKPHSSILLLRPGDFTCEELPEGARVVKRASPGKRYPLILAFCRDRKALDLLLARALPLLPADGALWLAWPKKSSGVTTDLGDAIVRATGLEAGLVDNKVAAIDATWSGLRFVVRVADRAQWPAP